MSEDAATTKLSQPAPNWFDSMTAHLSALNTPGTRRTARAVFAAVPVIMVNATAFIGQYAFLQTHLPWPTAGRILFAASLESIAIYVSYHAYLAQMKNDSALRLKLGAYLVALAVAAMNYSHYAGPHWKPTFAACGLAMMSLLSPVLWGIHSRRASRDALMALDQIEKRAVRLGATRWLWHVIRSTRVMYRATWFGVNEIQRAIAPFEARYGTADDPAPVRKRESVPDEMVRAVEVPAPAAESVPAIAQAPVPQDVPASEIPGTTVNQVSPGTVINEVSADTVHGEAALQADARVEGTADELTPEMVREAELYLAGLQLDPSKPQDGLPGERWLCINYLGDPTGNSRRRTARKLLRQRREAGTSLVAPIDGSHLNGRQPGMIATPNRQLPGGGVHG